MNVSQITRDQRAMIACIIVYGSIYVHGIIKGTIKPLLSTWLFISIAVVLSFMTNFADTWWAGLSNNMYNIIDGTCSLIIFLSVLFSVYTNRKFDKFELILLGCVMGIGIMRYTTSYNALAHMLIQIISTIAYIPTVKRLRWASSHEDSVAMWTINMIGSALGTIQPLLHNDTLPLLFAWRWRLCTMVVLICLLRIEYHKKQS